MSRAPLAFPLALLSSQVLLCAGTIHAQNFPLTSGSYLALVPSEAVGLSITERGAIVVALNRNVGDGDPSNDQAIIEIRRPDSLALLHSFPLTAPLRSLRSGAAGGPRWVATTDDAIVIGSTDGAAIEASWPVDMLAAAPRQAQVCAQRVAVLAGNQASLFLLSGALIGQFTLSASSLSDIACSSAPEQVFMTGYRQASSNLQVAFVESYTANGELLWRSWGWSAAQAQGQGLTSDTRGVVLHLGPDGALYFGGSSAGGVAVFNRDPKNLALAANNISFDSYNQTTNLGGPSISYYASLNPSNGALNRGQYLLTRLSSGAGNTVSTRALTVDQLGRLHLGGRANASMANRSTLQVAGMPVAGYAGADPHLLVASADFSAREHWTTFIAEGGRGTVTAAATLADRYALLIQNDQGGLLTPNGSIAATDLPFAPSASTPAAWLGTWGNTSYVTEALFADGFE